MKKFSTFAFVLLIGILTSCASLHGARQITPEEREKVQVVEKISVEWMSWQFLHIPPSEKYLEYKAVSKLRQSATKQGFKDIEIRNIEVQGGVGVASLLTYAPCCFLFCNVQMVTAYGDVVQYKNEATVIEKSIFEK